MMYKSCKANLNLLEISYFMGISWDLNGICMGFVGICLKFVLTEKNLLQSNFKLLVESEKQIKICLNRHK